MLDIFEWNLLQKIRVKSGGKAKGDTKDLDTTKGVKELGKGDKPRRQARRNLGRTFVGLNIQPHRSQLRSKMIKGKGDNMGRAENMGVIN
jgi:hypothetical protein